MTNFARIIDNTAVDVSQDPASAFHPSVAEQFVSVPDAVRAGWRLNGDQWSAPEPVEPAPTPNDTVVSPVQFKMLFTTIERVAIKAARADDAVIDDFFDLLDDPRLESVRLGIPSVRQMLEYLVSKSLLADQRVDQILTGQAV
jgi:hypothetical protein